MKSEIIIIGAGAAGLMAAKTLSEKNISFEILEAGDRIGGRARTLEGEVPIELGPEFLHGETPVTDALMEEFNLAWYDLKFPYHVYLQGKLREVPDFFDRICDVFRSLDNIDSDIPFTDYLAHFDAHSFFDQKLARSFVQGFDAADLGKISTKALGEMKAQVCDPKMRKMRRPLKGYGELLSHIALPFRNRIRFSHEVSSVHWNEGKVIISGTSGEGKTPFTMEAPKIIITVSLGVLRNIDLSPLPASVKKFLGRTEMGHVVKLVAEMEAGFFHQFDDHNFPFIASPDHCFTAWWSTTPVHSNLVTAWSGGEKARKLEGKTREEMELVFTQELAALTNLCPAKLASMIKKFHAHDWVKDPHFLGAYSYPVVTRQKPVPPETEFSSTLYFAGEAFHEEFSGTIEGALLTGKECAEKISESDSSMRKADISLPEASASDMN